LTEVDVEDALAGDHEEHESVEEVGASDVSKVTVVAVRNIGHVENVELRLTSTTGSVDWEEYWPSYGHSNKTGDNGHLEEAEEKITIESVVVQNVGVRKSEELAEPVGTTAWESRSSLP